MQPTLQPNERLLAVTPFSKAFFHAGSVVILQHFPLAMTDARFLEPEYANWRQVMSQAIGDRFIKRIVATANEVFRLPIRKIDPNIMPFVGRHAEREGSHYVWHVPADHVFVRGDSGAGADSVTWGPIPMSALRQIVLCRYPSLRRIR